MTRKTLIFLIFTAIGFASLSFKDSLKSSPYVLNYQLKLKNFNNSQQELVDLIELSNITSVEDIKKIKNKIQTSRYKLKGLDFWFRYLEPITYKKINGPLPVEWETEVFEKFEKPYKREGAGLTLAELYLNEPQVNKDSLVSLIKISIKAAQTYSADSITKHLNSYHHFYLCNRLFLLNLAAIYTTGFECPNPESIIPELKIMLSEVNEIYSTFNQSFQDYKLPTAYLALFEKAIEFLSSQPNLNVNFDHFKFIKEIVNPLFSMNQKLILQYKASSRSMVDYALNKNVVSIFDKSLYYSQNTKGIFTRVNDPKILVEIDNLGKSLFYDPILSGNNQRSCISCHKSTMYFTDTMGSTSLQFNRTDFLKRNTPSLINADFNHLLMLDGKHFTLQNQAKDVITNPIELGSKEQEIVQKVLNCKEYKKAFKKLLKYTPQENKITIGHIVSALTIYYSKFSGFYAPFDEAINENKPTAPEVMNGFNLFMGKAQCGTCHFVPQFNGIKPPYVSSEFEVLGVPEDIEFKALSKDKGRFEVNPAIETMYAFRTGSIRNSEFTAPYMHNGVFKTLDQVIDFYDAGGGAGHGLNVPNQTLSSDSLHLTKQEKSNLIAFIKSLNENIVFDKPPQKLPISRSKNVNKRKVGGEY